MGKGPHASAPETFDRATLAHTALSMAQAQTRPGSEAPEAAQPPPSPDHPPAAPSLAPTHPRRSAATLAQSPANPLPAFATGPFDPAQAPQYHPERPPRGTCPQDRF
jgi:hypothetical protein